MTDLLELHQRLMVLTDPMAGVLREAQWCERQANALEQDALQSGAMRDDVRVVLRFRRAGFGMRLLPELV